MPLYRSASPQISVKLFKTISRSTVDGQAAVSTRYQGKSESIDLGALMGDGSSVRTTKSVREPAGAFTITLSDHPQSSLGDASGLSSLDSVYGLVEPMDMVEIRMWNGLGPRPNPLPIIMRGFVSEVQRSQTMGDNGQPQRQVVISGQDYGKIWQIFQVLYLPAFADGKTLLTNFNLNELFGVGVFNVKTAADFVRTMVEKVLNPFMDRFIPPKSTMPRKLLTTDASILVKHGTVNQSVQSMSGSIYDILKLHGDVGIWNELYTEDREDGVHVVYRPVPAMLLSPDSKTGSRKIQDDAPDPVYVPIPDSDIQSQSVARSDSDVANFFWVENSRFDLIGDIQRKLASIPQSDPSVSITDYPNSAVKFYGVRPMYASTQQGGDEVKNMTSGQDEETTEQRDIRQVDWLAYRRKAMMQMNKDNVVLERGSARIKGGPVRAATGDGKIESMKAGDYARFQMGRLQYDAYVSSISHEFVPFDSYTTTLTFERGEGFANRISLDGGVNSPWLAEQARHL